MSDVETALTGAEVVPVASETQAQAPEPTTENVDPPKPEQPRDEAGRFVPQARVNEITRARREAERQAQAANQRAEALERELASLRQPAASPQSNDVPTLESCGWDQAAYTRAVIDYATKQATDQMEKRHKAHEQARTRETLASDFDERAHRYEAEHPGFSERLDALARTIAIAPEVREVVMASEHGPAVADYLATHLDEADRISRLPLHLAALSLGRIEAQVSAPKPSKPVSNAPNPPPTLAGGKATVARNPDDMTVDEWVAWRRTQLKR